MLREGAIGKRGNLPVVNDTENIFQNAKGRRAAKKIFNVTIAKVFKRLNALHTNLITPKKALKEINC